MSYIVIRKDLTMGLQKCDLCSRPLNSLKAYVMEDTLTGKIILAGPTCALKNLADGYSLSGVPDFSTFTETVNTHLGGGHGNVGSKNVVDQDDQEKQRALEYLLLREEKLPKEMKLSYKALYDVYKKNKINELPLEKIKFINNFEAKAPVNLKLSSLKKIYNDLHWIDVGISQIPAGKTFFSSIRKSLIEKQNLSTKQIDGVNKWLIHIPSVPPLKYYLN